MNRTIRMTRLCSLGLVALAAIGCGRGGPELCTVSGTVTLDGKPLANAKVEFQPKSGGSPSEGTTNEKGYYELQFSVGRPGAMLGKHDVRITTFRQERGEGEQIIDIPERVPPQYNGQTTLVREVESGSNEFDFPLQGALR